MNIVCGIYARDSTDQQGDTVENQISQAREFISRLGPEYVVDEDCIFIDSATSGYYTSVFDRDAMKKAVELAKGKKYSVLVFKEVSRVGRDKQENPAIVGMFEQYGIRVIAINDNYDSLNKDNITFGILSVLAEQESRKTSVRVSTGKREKARRGLWNADAPIGYILNSDTQKLEIDPESKEIIETIFNLYVNGLGGLRIAMHLNENGKRTREGNLFSRHGIRKLIGNPAYIGNTVYGKRRNELKREYDDTGRMTKKKVQVKIAPSEWIVVEGTHEPIVSKEVFYTAQNILSGRGHNRKPRRAYHPLTGILFCGKCGQGMVCQKRSHANKEYRYYICKTYHKYGRNACPQANVNADKLEPAIVDVVRARLSGRQFNIKATLNRAADIERLENERKVKIKAKEKAQKDQVDTFQQRDLFDEEVYQSQMVALKKEVQSLEKEIGILDNQIKSIKDEGDKSANISKIAEKIASMDIGDVETLRTTLHDLIEKITLSGDDVDIKYHYALI